MISRTNPGQPSRRRVLAATPYLAQPLRSLEQACAELGVCRTCLLRLDLCDCGREQQPVVEAA